MADSTINGLTELSTIKGTDLIPVWEQGAQTRQTKKVKAENARKYFIMEATCGSAGNSTQKNVTIDANAIPERLAVTFTYGNTVGDTTDPAFTPLILHVSYNGGSSDFEICDSLGNYAGKGFGGGLDGGIIIFQLLSTKALITNSDIRQKDTNYVIKADGYCEIIAPAIQGENIFPVVFRAKPTIFLSDISYGGNYTMLYVYTDYTTEKFTLYSSNHGPTHAYRYQACGLI